MIAPDDGGSAFPVPWSYATSASGPGMSLRDWFAGRAMQAQIEAMGGIEGEPIDDWAAYAYCVADAMLAARKGERR